MKPFTILLAPVLLAAGALGGCQGAAEPQGLASAGTIAGTDTHGFARRACSGCHAIEQGGLSRNPSAPPFHAVANRPGVTLASLTNWLRNAHNYPDEMNFALTDDEEGALAVYIYSLRDEQGGL